MSTTGWIPTRKWMVAQVVALAALATGFIESGGWDDTETKLLIGIAVQALSTYLISNQPTAGGVPDAGPPAPPIK